MRWFGTGSRHRRDREHDALVAALRTAVADGDAVALHALLHSRVLAVIDDGHEQPQATGAAAVASMLLATLHAPTPASVNGRAGLLDRSAERLAVISVNVRGGCVVEVWVTTDPGKLTQWM